MIKDLKKSLKQLADGKVELIPHEESMARVKQKLERDKHFPYTLFRWFRRKKRQIKDGWYWLTCWLFHPYNRVTAKTLPPTWVDADIRMLHISFEIFRSVIEDEEIFEHVGFDLTSEIERMEKETWDDEDSRQMHIKSLKEEHETKTGAEKELRYLYKWWTEIRPDRVRKHEESVPMSKRTFREQFDIKDEEFSKACSDYGNLDNKYYDEDTEHLIRLMKMRGYLWV